MPRIRNLLLGVAVGAAVSTGAAGIATLTTATAANASPLPQSSPGWHGPHWGCWGWHTLHAAKKCQCHKKTSHYKKKHYKTGHKHGALKQISKDDAVVIIATGDAVVDYED